MTIRCEMNQILLRTIKNHLNRHILGEKCITSTLLSRQNKCNLCYGPILFTGVLRNFYCNF